MTALIDFEHRFWIGRLGRTNIEEAMLLSCQIYRRSSNIRTFDEQHLIFLKFLVTCLGETVVSLDAASTAQSVPSVLSPSPDLSGDPITRLRACFSPQPLRKYAFLTTSRNVC